VFFFVDVFATYRAQEKHRLGSSHQNGEHELVSIRAQVHCLLLFSFSSMVVGIKAVGHPRACHETMLRLHASKSPTSAVPVAPIK
jgi:hypothetical protein